MHSTSIASGGSLVVGAVTVVVPQEQSGNTATVARNSHPSRSAASNYHLLQHQFLESIGQTKLVSLGRYLGLTYMLTKAEIIKGLKSVIESTPSMLLPDGSINFESTMFTHHQIYPKDLTQLSKYQLWTFSDICGIPYYPTKAEYAGVIKNQLLDSVSPLVGEDSMVNLQFTPKLSRREASDISNMPIHINRLEVLSHAQLVTFCKMFGVPSVKPKVQLVEELRLYLTSNPCAVIEDGVLIPGNEKSLKSNSSKKALSKPVCLYSLDTSRFDDIQVICRSYGISIMISKEQLFERFRTHLHKHPEIIRADGTVDLVALANTKG
ncbi:hypothetical protein BASA83_009583 [Batrachochytrium salamandrivorans]|nr:hypothetical protein BASA83_009583 [Batrachochytrium salamandrivorans]